MSWNTDNAVDPTCILYKPISLWVKCETSETNVKPVYDTRCYFNVRSKADISQLNLPHGKGFNKVITVAGWSSLMARGVKVKGKGKRSIAVRKKPHRYGNSHVIWDHTVLPATRQRWHSRLYPSRSWYSIKWPRRDARLSWPSWLVTARDGIPAQRWSPIPVVTGPDVR